LGLKAIIFDVDGTLADTERHGHWPASNEAFRTHGYNNIQWSWEEYKWLMHHHHGTTYRVKYSLEQHTNLPPAERDSVALQISEKKRALYLNKYVGSIPLRSGIASFIDETIENNLRLAIVTQSHEDQVDALLRHHLPGAMSYFDSILGSGSGPKTDPASPLYKRCLAELGLTGRDVIAIEDSENGLQAAVAAGLPCAVFYNSYTFGQNFSNAALVARSIKFFKPKQLAALCQHGTSAD
jgi:HAD superfamily hydrolase (TIGR01509 family)